MTRNTAIVLLLALMLLPTGVLAAAYEDPGPCCEISATALTADEIHWLTYMREEEKLARDVYLSLSNKWNMPVFARIAASEQIHMNAVKTLLVRYGVPDPVAGMAPGEFSDLYGFEDTYAELTEQGSASKAAALGVGVHIEETDIEDLNKAIAATTHRDIRTVYTNLRNGSSRHLAAFESRLLKY